MTLQNLGILTLILKALLNPLAKKPPNGPIREAKVDSAILWIWNGYIRTVFCRKKKNTSEKDFHQEQYCSLPALLSVLTRL